MQFKSFVLSRLKPLPPPQHHQRNISFSPETAADSRLDDVLFPLARLDSSHDGGVHVDRVRTFSEIAGNSREIHRRLKVTWILRSGSSRRVLNFPAVQKMILETGLVDTRWFMSHIMYFDNLSFHEQVYILSQTDILISVHSAGLFNGIFMREQSAAVQIFNSRFIEFVFTPPLRQAGIMLFNLPSFSHNASDYGNFSDCPNVPPGCWNTSRNIFEAGSINCVKIRQCSVWVDIDRFHITFLEAYYHVLSAKFLA
jgi:hypothetical protein